MSQSPNFFWIPVFTALLASACAANGSGEKNRPTPDCTPTTCVAEGAVCGTLDDGCGAVLNCGGCAQGEVCGGHESNKCGTTACTPTTCQAQGLNCGTISDGCDGELVCGECTSPESCNGAGEPNVCGCTPTTCEAEGAVCGSIDDGCGNLIPCGDCPDGQTCGGEAPNQCSDEPCVPTTCDAEGKNCGDISDRCESEIPCGTCDNTQICGSEIANVCGDAPAPRAGDVLITEIMKNPVAAGDSTGEWIELHNVSDQPLELAGCKLEDLGSDVHTISPNSMTLVIPAGAYLVLGNEDDSALNGGVTVAYQYGDFALANGDDEVILTCGAVEVDQVAYDASFPNEQAFALSLTASAYDSVANDDGSNWCNATATFGAGDYGTPGADNGECPCVPVRSCESAGANCGTVQDGCGVELACGTCEATQICGMTETNVCGTPAAPIAGELLITEIMKNPKVVGDDVGEWFELHNPGSLPLQLKDCVISDLGTDSVTLTAEASLVIGAGEYIVLGVNTDTAVNGGVSVTYHYGSVNEFRLAGAEDEVILTCGGVEVDQVAYDNTFPNNAGVSLSLDPELFDSTLNDEGEAWCDASSNYGAGDLGTPGAANDACIL